MRISNETKIGVLTAIGIVVLILGFNFLKGNSLFDKKTNFYVEFPNVDGLAPSNPVMINGLQVGAVSALREKDRNVSGVVVELRMSKDLLIPKDSKATINPSLGGLGVTTISIALGTATEYLQNGDTIGIHHKPGVVEELKKNLAPTLERVNSVMDSLKLTLGGINQTLDPGAQQNIRATIAHLAASTASLQQLLHAQQGALAKSLNNVERFTGTLAGNEQKINNVLENVEKTTAKLSEIELEKTINALHSSVISLDSAMAKLNNTEGSAGLLLNDQQLYRNLENSTRSLNILLDDLRMHPKRYVNFSVFGRKDKSGPLTKPAPIDRDTITVKGDTVIVK